MPSDEKYPADDRKEIDYTVGTLNATFNAVLKEFDRSAVEVKFPQAVDFNGNSLDLVSAKAAAQTVRLLVKRGNLVIAVMPGFTFPLYSIGQYSVVEGNRAKEARFIGAFFTGDFFARCLADGSEPENIVKKVIGQIVYQDALLSAAKLKPDSLPLKNPDTLVSVYHGPKLVRR